jgi:hypothetical protein
MIWTTGSFNVTLRRSSVVVALLSTLVAPPARADYVAVTNLLSDGSVQADNTDGNLKNPWGMAYGPGGPFRVNETLTAQSEKFDGTGVNDNEPFTNVVTIPAVNPPPNTGPTGLAYNSTNGTTILTPVAGSAASMAGMAHHWRSTACSRCWLAMAPRRIPVLRTMSI